MGSLSRSVIFDAGANPPQRMWKRRIDPNTDEVVIEKYPYGLSAKWVDANGNVRHVKLTNAAASPRDLRYENRITGALRANNGIPYAQCPLRDEQSKLSDSFFPEAMRLPCERNTYGEEKACIHVEHIIATRQAKNAAAEDERAARYNRKERMEEAKLAAAQQANEKLVEVLEKLTESEASKAKRSSR